MEPNRPPGMPKNHAPGRCVSKDCPPKSDAERRWPRCRRCRGARCAPARTGGAAMSVESVVAVSVSEEALGVTSSMGDSLVPFAPGVRGLAKRHETAVILSQPEPLLGSPKLSLTGFSGISQPTRKTLVVTKVKCGCHASGRCHVRVLVLGGDGYLGWPTALHLSRAGYEVAVADNFARRGYDLEMGVDSLVPIASLHRRVERWEEVSGNRLERLHRRPDRGGVRLRHGGRVPSGHHRALRRAAQRALLHGRTASTRSTPRSTTWSAP